MNYSTVQQQQQQHHQASDLLYW